MGVGVLVGGTGVSVGGTAVLVGVAGSGVLVGSGFGVLVGSGLGVAVGSGFGVFVGTGFGVSVGAGSTAFTCGAGVLVGSGAIVAVGTGATAGVVTGVGGSGCCADSQANTKNIDDSAAIAMPAMFTDRFLGIRVIEIFTGLGSRCSVSCGHCFERGFGC